MKNKAIFSFAGDREKFLAHKQEFYNFLNENFSNFDHHYFFENKKIKDACFYHCGINGKTKDIKESAEYIKNIVNKYDETIFIGSSMGGYAAILFGCLSGATKVLSFKPQTNIINIRPKNNFLLDKEYIDLTKINLNGPIIEIHGDLRYTNPDNDHWYGQVERMNIQDNISIVLHESLNLKEFRNSGKLLKIFNNFILDNDVNI